MEKLKRLLRELFQFDCTDLDFGIYCIMNHKRDVIERFITLDLPSSIAGALAEGSQAAQELQEVAAQIRETLGPEALDAEDNLAEASLAIPLGRRYLTLIDRAAGVGGREALEASIYNHLYAFYGRYYQDGDFVSKRRYSKRERYAIPYNGEEVCLYWANHDQYYVKTGEHCTDYTFSAPDGVTVRFHADEETRASAVDIPETLNYLIGLHEQTRRVCPDEERREAVILRQADGWEQADYERDRDCVAEEALAVGADEVYVNGDSLVPGARALEPILRARMFAPVEAKRRQRHPAAQALLRFLCAHSVVV